MAVDGKGAKAEVTSPLRSHEEQACNKVHPYYSTKYQAATDCQIR